MALSRKDYKAIAAVLHAVRKAYEDNKVVTCATAEITLGLGEVFATQNKRFDKLKFYAAVLRGE